MSMQITIVDDRLRLRTLLSDRLDRVAALTCGEHGEPVVAVTIHARENGWFETTWIACCETLERHAASIIKERC